MKRTDLMEIRLEVERRLQEARPNDASCVKMTIRDDSDFLSDYWSEKPVISSEAADFLDNSMKALDWKKLKDLSVEISSAPLDEFEKSIFTEAIHNYYRNRLYENHNDLRRNQRNSLILFVVGALILALMVVLEHFGMRPYLSEIFDIIGWVFVWEATDEFFLERHSLVVQEKVWKALSEAKVRYRPLDPLDHLIVNREDENPSGSCQ